MRALKMLILSATLATSLTARPAAAFPDEYDDTQSHPLRVAVYVLHPIGYALEWLVFRPFHYVVSNSAQVFGHRPHGESHVD